MASSVDECVGKFQCMLGVLSIIVPFQVQRTPAGSLGIRTRDTPVQKQNDKAAKWRELVVLANAELELPPAVPERIEQLGFCFWRMDANSCSVCKPGNTLQNARSIFQHVPSFFLHFPWCYSLQSKCSVIRLDQSNCRDFGGPAQDRPSGRLHAAGNLFR